jgi:hypothetical protein
LTLTGCCSSGIKRDLFTDEAEILPIKSLVMNFGLEGGDYLSSKFQVTISGKKVYLDIADFDEFKWGTYYKVVLRGYTNVRCDIQDAPTEVRFYRIEKILSKRPSPAETCFEEVIAKSRGNDPEYYATWEKSFSKAELQISEKNAQFIKTDLGNQKISYRVCVMDPAKQKIRIDNFAILP